MSNLATLLDIKEIISPPYHPHPQENIERSHSTWKRKLENNILYNNIKKKNHCFKFNMSFSKELLQRIIAFKTNS